MRCWCSLLLAVLLCGCPDGDCEDADGDGVCDYLDCAPADPNAYPDADDPYGDGLDSNCDGIDGLDHDQDDHPRQDDAYEGPFDAWDCDDLDSAIHPGQDDPAGDGVDADCDGVDGVDSDGDGYASTASGGDDCDDADADVHPAAEEVCDGVDNDCDGDVDDGTGDADGDGFPDCIDPTPDGYDGPVDREAPLSSQLHLHGSLSEFSATMAYHTAQANQYGVDVLWWSDHDAMIQMLARSRGMDFDNGALTSQVEDLGSVVEYGFQPVSDDLASSSSELLSGGPSGLGSYWHLEAESGASGDWQSLRHSYEGDFFAHHVPLMAEAEISLTLRPRQEASEAWQLQVTLSLSGSMDVTTNTITYYLGGEELNQTTSAHALYVPIFASADEWTTVTFPITETAIQHFYEQEDQGCHQLYVELFSRDGAHVEVDLDDLVVSWNVEGEPLRELQTQMLDERYSYGTVTHFVGQEMTPVLDRRHVNVLGVDIPMHDYTATGVLSIDEAVEYVHQQGGMALCDHPFGTGAEILYEGEAAETLVLELADEWIAADGFGCDAVEVGYQSRVIGLQDYLLFWDELARGGLYITGVGTSDNHWVGDWMDDSTIGGKNRGLTWVFLDEPSPVGIMEQLGNGRAFFGDPLPFIGEEPLLDLWTEHGAVMGQVLVSDLDQVIHVETGYVEPGWTLALVGDDGDLDAATLDGAEVDTTFVVERGELHFIRAELRDGDGMPILVSNPLYLEMPI